MLKGPGVLPWCGLVQHLLCRAQLSDMFEQWEAGFIILYKLCYKLCRCKPGFVLYVVWLALKKKKNHFLGLLTKEIKNLRVQWKASMQKATFYLHILSTVKFVCLWQAWDYGPLLSSVCFCKINNWRGSLLIPISPFET